MLSRGEGLGVRGKGLWVRGKHTAGASVAKCSVPTASAMHEMHSIVCPASTRPAAWRKGEHFGFSFGGWLDRAAVGNDRAAVSKDRAAVSDLQNALHRVSRQYAPRGLEERFGLGLDLVLVFVGWIGQRLDGQP